MPTKVSEYMSRKVISVNPDMGVRQAFFLMRQHEIRHLPIVDQQGLLQGIISDRELRRPNWVDEAPDITHVYDLNDDLCLGDVMVNNVFSLNTYDTLSKAVKLLQQQNIGAAPVLDKTGALVGMLSAVDLLSALDDILGQQKSYKKRD